MTRNQLLLSALKPDHRLGNLDHALMVHVSERHKTCQEDSTFARKMDTPNLQWLVDHFEAVCRQDADACFKSRQRLVCGLLGLKRRRDAQFDDLSVRGRTGLMKLASIFSRRGEIHAYSHWLRRLPSLELTIGSRAITPGPGGRSHT